MEWSFDGSKDHTKKLWRYEDAGGFQTQRLRENVHLGIEKKMSISNPAHLR